MTYWPYIACKKCSGKAQPGTVALMKYLILRFPQTSSFGIYNCRSVAGSSNLSEHACGRAGDSKIPTLSNGRANTSVGYPLVQFLDQHSTVLGIIMQIYDRVIYDDASPRGRAYGGVHPHYDHVHWSQTPAKATSLTYDKIVTAVGPPNLIGDEYEMKKGDKGLAVAEVQHALDHRWGYDLGTWPPFKGADGKVMKSQYDGKTFVAGTDGAFGSTMEALVKKFQAAQNLPVTGIVDGITHSMIFGRYGTDSVGGGLTKAEADNLYASKALVSTHLKDVKSTTPHS